jgi:hypothetical protein
MNRFSPIALAALGFAAACGDITAGVPDGVKAGIIASPYDTLTALVVPDTVAANQTFDAQVNTFAYNSCYSTYDSQVEQQSDSATIVAYDRVQGTTCTVQIRRLTRLVPLTFTRTGNAVVVLRGVEDTGANGNVFAQVSRTVYVK